jgi:hypothetical protein
MIRLTPGSLNDLADFFKQAAGASKQSCEGGKNLQLWQI